MRLPKSLINPDIYIKPNFYLCETDKTRMCQLETVNTNGTFKFNSYSEISFEVSRTYNDLITGVSKVNPFYDKIEALRLIEVENIGYFEIQGPDLSSDGIKEAKSITAYSLEYTLSQKYLEDFYTTNGRDEWDGSLEDIWQIKHNDSETVPSIVLYNPTDPDASVLHLILEKIYGWEIGYVDKQLWSLSRDFDVDRESVYDFIINEICEKFNCYAVFDTINNKINFYAESLTSKFIGDGTTKEFFISPPFVQIGTVSIDGYKTSQWEYDSSTGALTLNNAPENGAMIEVIDGALEEWETDVFVTFDNLSQEININYDAESIKTVLTVSYGDDGDIREINLGLPYLVDLSYYYTPEWMGQDLYDAYTAYLQKTNSFQSDFTESTKKRLELGDKIDFEEHRLSLHYSIASVDHGEKPENWTVGTYYVRGGEAPNYYYTEVTLPEDYKPNTIYYSMNTANLDETKVGNLYTIFQIYFNNNSSIYMFQDELSGEWNVNTDNKKGNWESEIDKLEEDFKFMETYTLSKLKSDLKNVESGTLEDKNKVILAFLGVMWNEVGRTPLQELYLDAYKQLQTFHMNMDKDDDWDGGNWSDPNHSNYWVYYPVTLMIESLESAIAERTTKIDSYQSEINDLNANISNISNELLITNNFTPEQQIRLSAFLREDELKLDDIIDTDIDDLNQIYKNKQDAMESGRIELQKLSQPQLQFSMNMANIYALPEFEPIIDQFQLGNVIKVALRRDYIKQSRLLQVNINFDDFSDFSCEFGDLTNLRTQSDIHADLLKKAVQAGKSVATSGSYWTKGADKASATDNKIQQGLLDAATQIKSIDGTQGTVIDKYGIKLQKKLPDGTIDPEQVWMVNNQIVFTDDNFKTSRSALGKVTVDGIEYYGLISDIVLSGYIEGSKIKGSEIEGGTIKIGDLGDGKWALIIDKDGNVSMLGDYVKFRGGEDGYNSLADSFSNIQGQIDTTTTNLQGQITEINSKNKYEVKIVADGLTTITSEDDVAVLSCEVYSWDTLCTNTIDAQNFYWKRKSSNSINFIGDGAINFFDKIPKNCVVSEVYVDGILTTGYTYNSEYGTIIFEEPPGNGAIIEIIDKFDADWNNDQDHQGKKSITITHKDIYENSSFYCDVDLPE